MNFEPVIGIEIHIELKTASKMFSSAPCAFGKQPNTEIVPYDLGFPGTMPSLNMQAVKFGIQFVTALNMKIEPLLQFDRKNYFYPDLPKGYQITQQEHPIGSDGYLDIETSSGIKRIGIERAHLEEDTAKQLHLGDMSLVDYNRAGTPLIEVVSRPDMHSGEEAMKYVEAIREIVTFLGVSDGKMEEGSMRCDVNISLRPYGQKEFGTKCEIKNLNSIANVKAALDYEIQRQSQILLSGEKVQQETRRYDESKKCTSLMRVKSNAVDYKYFREPNIVPIRLSDEFISSAIQSMAKLPAQYKKELLEEGLTSLQADVLLNSKANVDYFEEVRSQGVKDVKTLWNYLMVDILSYLNKQIVGQQGFDTLKFTPKMLADFVNYVSLGKINSKQAKQVLEIMYNEGKDPNKVVSELGLEQISDTSVIEKIVDEVLSNNAQSISDYKAGHDRALGYIVGQVMKASKGKANPSIAKELILKKLETI